jgi:hypothetical protein
VDRDGRRWVGWVPCLEGGEAFVERVAADTAMVQCTMLARFALRSRGWWRGCGTLAGLLPDGGADNLAVGVDAVLPADVEPLRRLFDHDGLAEGRLRWSPSGLMCRVLMCCLL